jgi:hypothetical protein
MSNKDEIDRIRRRRDRQLRARDPKKKQREHERRVSKKFKKKKVTVLDVLRDIPGKWWGLIIGGILGFTVALILDQVLKIKPIPQIDAFWVEYIWYTLILFGVAVGWVIGVVLDWQEEDHDKMVVRGRK